MSEETCLAFRGRLRERARSNGQRARKPDPERLCRELFKYVAKQASIPKSANRSNYRLTRYQPLFRFRTSEVRDVICYGHLRRFAQHLC